MGYRIQLFICIVLAGLLELSPGQAAETNAWQRTDAYVPPDFAGYFPEDPAKGERLIELDQTGKLTTMPANEAIQAVRLGLRTAYWHHLSILRTFGNRFIWNRTPQNPQAIELMYHAAGYAKDPDPESTCHLAIYFGLSVADQKTPNILRTLVEICVRKDDPNILSRVAWGIRSQREECLEYLEPYLNDPAEAVKAKAQIVQKILRQELNAFTWATEEARQRAETQFRGELPEIKRVLQMGSSEERSQILEKIFRHRIELIMDDSFLAAFAACAHDINPRVRDHVTKLVGNQWVWQARQQHPEAIQLMLRLSYDPDREVRYNAVYYGLSTVRDKSEAVIQRLVELLLKDHVKDMQGRIHWGLKTGPKTQPDQLRRILVGYLADPDPKVATAAAELIKNWLPLPTEEMLVRDAEGFRRAVSEAKPGIRILLAPGIYPGDYHFSNLHGETNRPIVISAADPANPPVIQNGRGGLQLSKAAFVELLDLIIRNMSGNGLNIDDGGSLDTPSHHIVLRGLKVSEVGPQGNRDAIKLSGVVDFRVEGCVIESWGTGGGSGIDMVGCHRGVIASNRFRHTDTAGSTGVQAKGGSSQIAIRHNRFENAGGRAINIGGSTGLQFFRPPLKPGEEHCEAKDIRVEGNTFMGGGTPVAFVGVDGAVVRFNTIYHPKRWALRILQETQNPGFVPSRNGEFTDNIVAFYSTDWVEGGVNIGSGTAPETFRFARNWWYCLDQPERSRPRLPTEETDGVYGKSPQFRDAAAGDLRLQDGSPASQVGADAFGPAEKISVERY